MEADKLEKVKLLMKEGGMRLETACLLLGVDPEEAKKAINKHSNPFSHIFGDIFK